MRRMMPLGCCAAVVVLFLCQSFTHAAITASATLSSQQLGPNSYEYSLILNNTGTTPISTFWFAWEPFYDYLPSNPSSASAPAGWNGSPVADGFYGGYSVEWTTTTSPLAAGASLSGFKFDTSDPPSVINGISPQFPFRPVETSWVYQGLSQADPGYRFATTTVVPEPSLALLLPLSLLLRRRRSLKSCAA